MIFILYVISKTCHSNIDKKFFLEQTDILTLKVVKCRLIIITMHYNNNY